MLSGLPKEQHECSTCPSIRFNQSRRESNSVKCAKRSRFSHAKSECLQTTNPRLRLPTALPQAFPYLAASGVRACESSYEERIERTVASFLQTIEAIAWNCTGARCFPWRDEAARVDKLTVGHEALRGLSYRALCQALQSPTLPRKPAEPDAGRRLLR